jgi:hypothetical protein
MCLCGITTDAMPFFFCWNVSARNTVASVAIFSCRGEEAIVFVGFCVCEPDFSTDGAISCGQTKWRASWF